MIRYYTRLDIHKLRELRTTFPKKTLASVLNGVAQGVVNDMRASWTPNGPSQWGEAPAVKTGRLDRGFRVMTLSGSWLSFAAGQINGSVGNTTAVGIFNVMPYSTKLEDPSLMNRPYVAPSLERAGISIIASAMTPEIFK